MYRIYELRLRQELAAARSELPRHIAVLCDGNRRWAEARGLPVALGHKAGADAARRAVEASVEQGVTWLTLFAFSSENWKRPAEEVSFLMGLVLVAVEPLYAETQLTRALIAAGVDPSTAVAHARTVLADLVQRGRLG